MARKKHLFDVEGIGKTLLERIKERWPLLEDDAALRANPYLLTQIELHRLESRRPGRP